MRSLFFIALLSIAFWACKSNNSATSKKIKQLDLLYGLWKVDEFKFTDGKTMAGVYMGNPQYDFSEEGKRTKTLNTIPAPPPEIIDYVVDGDSIRYPSKPKFPAMKIAKLTKDSLILSNSKLSWYLYK